MGVVSYLLSSWSFIPKRFRVSALLMVCAPASRVVVYVLAVPVYFFPSIFMLAVSWSAKYRVSFLLLVRVNVTVVEDSNFRQVLYVVPSIVAVPLLVE